MARPELEEIRTDRLRLRRYDESDVDNVFRLIGDPQVMRYFPSVYDRDRAQKIVNDVLAAYDELGYSVLAVERQPDGAYVGQIGLLDWKDVDDRPDIEVAYMLAPEAWGRGYATEAARACRDWAFAHLDVDRLVSYIAIANAPSIRVAERNGMSRIKRLDENRFGIPIYVYAVQRAEWESGHRQ